MSTVAVSIEKRGTTDESVIEIMSEADTLSFRAQSTRTSWVVTFGESGEPELVSIHHSRTCQCGDTLCPNESGF